MRWFLVGRSVKPSVMLSHERAGVNTGRETGERRANHHLGAGRNSRSRAPCGALGWATRAPLLEAGDQRGQRLLGGSPRDARRGPGPAPGEPEGCFRQALAVQDDPGLQRLAAVADRVVSGTPVAVTGGRDDGTPGTSAPGGVRAEAGGRECRRDRPGVRRRQGPGRPPPRSDPPSPTGRSRACASRGYPTRSTHRPPSTSRPKGCRAPVRRAPPPPSTREQHDRRGLLQQQLVDARDVLEHMRLG